MQYTVDLKYPVNLSESMNSGQLFRWKGIDGQYWGLLEEFPVGIRQIAPRTLRVDSPYDPAGRLLNFFRDEDQQNLIILQISKDEHIRIAIELYPGLRIFRQDPWECLISFMCSPASNIPKISATLNLISKKWGYPLEFDAKIFYQFPNPDQLAQLTIRKLKTTTMGFRAKYILQTSQFISAHPNFFNQLKNASYETARNELMNLTGIGPKVADCVLLFSLDKLEAFPVDVWIKKAITDWYFGGKKTSEKKITEFGRNYFGPYAGYAQQYLFHRRRLSVTSSR